MYLSKLLKDYYLEDFKKVLLIPEGNYYSLDKGLDTILVELNKINDIQTIFSKKAQPNNNFKTEHTSFIYLAYSKKIENILIEKLDELKKDFGEQNILISVEKYPPQENVLYKEKSSIEIGCFTNKNYFQLFHFVIELDSLEDYNHDEFWKKLAIKLKSIPNV